jgi:hypothetical protein
MYVELHYILWLYIISGGGCQYEISCAQAKPDPVTCGNISSICTFGKGTAGKPRGAGLLRFLEGGFVAERGGVVRGGHLMTTILRMSFFPPACTCRK